ncbi:MAG: ABC transporter ATP-binding protein/permease [Ilumatobacteraceae bacterium]|jgi:ATP-binding cassette, subfamily B, bacterial|nr:ABC transporter ATP-binding protein/permease [Ilumatobacteraceae bacterium]MDP4706386.1 ABC transporter ATP-binding protein/permease [Ilumatobacteraceae bacterium]MDP4713269.1 ABC transporter ATP-binding protein/permease [Ilumatobacteraceae bacterium]MDP4935821.1 ABC transporter ATP-binding protein/permease [Ilumatobacteraceae bacterium]MDP4976964.1 ABC transporter ATP-binding protein/permease [Ilumatobacteraceae bacterium]
MWSLSAVSEEDRLDRVQTLRVLRRAYSMARSQRRLILSSLVFVFIGTLVTLAGPTLVRFAIDNGIKVKDGSALNQVVVLYVIVTIIGYFAGRLQYITINRAGEGFLRELRITVFDKLQKQSMSYFDREKAGVLVSRMTADIESMAELIQFGLLQFVSAFLLLCLATILLFVMSWQLSLVTMLVLPILIIASIRFQRTSNHAYLDVREKVGNNLSTLQEGITGVRVIQAYGQEENRSERFRQSNRALFDSHMYSVRISTWYFGLVEFAGIAATGAIIGVGGWLVHRDSVTIGTVTAFVLLLANLFDPVQQLSQLYNTVQSSTAALHKLIGIIDAVPDVDEVEQPTELPSRGAIVVDRVTFGYAGSDRPALSDISISVADGERLALVGPTGAGKSTLAKLMARLYDPSAVDGVAGSVSFGGVDLRLSSMTDLRRRIIVVPQEGFCFGGTIRENIRIARPEATDTEVEQALESIGALDRFVEFSEGLETEVRERGSRLSAGERQLIALARAALVDPAVLVLDEATSNLDPGTEAVVEHALETLMTGRTVIVVAHRLTTVRRADRIGVIDHGSLVELGSHDELVALGGRYAALADAWQRSQPK